MTLAVTLLIYFLPAIIAVLRRHNSTVAIVITQMVLLLCAVVSAMMGLVGIGFITAGLTFLVWIVGLIWACSSNTRLHDERLARLMAEAIRQDIGELGLDGIQLSLDVR
jgi:hypothetical protein